MTVKEPSSGKKNKPRLHELAGGKGIRWEVLQTLTSTPQTKQHRRRIAPKQRQAWRSNWYLVDSNLKKGKGRTKQAT